MVNHPNRRKTDPSNILANRCREAGAVVKLMWEISGPKNTMIAWLSCYAVNGHICVVETYKDGNGWEAFTTNRSNNLDDTVNDVLSRCEFSRGDAT